ncbi:MAG: LysM peptidoglycan-binding domain-containing protein, partial [Clostridia bacterium]|nr:LysM peptidoglycan-binding domain-containing protein [Clostridia bacterium]
VTVASGDTLRNLCSPYKPSNMDIRDFIEKVRYENKLPNSELVVGQEIVISLN